MSDRLVSPLTAPNGQRHRGGRPRLPDTDRAILRAVGELMAEQGMSGTTINAVAARSGVARGTVYRRYPNRSAMIAGAVRASATGGRSRSATTSRRITASRRRRRGRCSPSPAFQAIMPALLEMGLNGEADDEVRSTVFPRRRQLAEMYERLAGPAGYRTDITPELPNDLLVGAMIYRLIYDGAPPTSDEVQGMVDVILDGIRRREDERERFR